MRELQLESEIAQVEITNDRVAVMASYGSTPRITRSVDEFVRQLADADYQVLLVRASENPSPLEWPTTPAAAVVLRRPNVGYDFGSWAATLNALPELRRARRVLLVNDSLVGPFAPIAPLLEHFESSTADAWGAVANPQIMPHLQSFFLGFRNGMLDDPPLKEFWRSIRPQTEKMDYVMKFVPVQDAGIYQQDQRQDVAASVRDVENPDGLRERWRFDRSERSARGIGDQQIERYADVRQFLE